MARVAEVKFITKFNKNGQIEYEGQMLYDFYHGKGKLHLMNGHYEGDFRYGKWHGKGTRVIYHHCEIKGQVVIKYCGEFACGKYCGEGSLYENDRLVCRGQWMDDRFVDGVKYNSDNVFEGLMYSGNAIPFSSHTYVPIGTYTYSNGARKQILAVKWSNGTAITKEIWFDEEGRKNYEGEVVNNQKHGHGVVWMLNGNRGNDMLDDGENYSYLKYEGNFSRGSIQGKGVMYYPNGNKWLAGRFNKGVIDGEGIFYESDGFKRYDGKFSKGKMHGEGMLYERSGIMRMVRYTNGTMKNTQKIRK